MNLMDVWGWLDVLSKLAYSSDQSFESRIFYARWWLTLADVMDAEFDKVVTDLGEELEV